MLEVKKVRSIKFDVHSFYDARKGFGIAYGVQSDAGMEH